jgi:hypothetical protein
VLLNSSFEKDKHTPVCKHHAMKVHTRSVGKVLCIPFESPRESSPQYLLDKTLDGAQSHSGFGDE